MDALLRELENLPPDTILVPDDAMIEGEALKCNEESKDEEKEAPAVWATRGKNYTAVVDTTLNKQLPSGVYRIEFERRFDEYVFKPCVVNSDELYTFTNNISNQIIEEVNKFWDKEKLYAANKLIHKRGILLAGPAGTGKSALITLIIKELLKKDGLIFLINSVRELNDYYNSIKSIVRKVEPSRPIITIIEDVDKILRNLDGDDSPLLDLLDGKNSSDHILTILTSNDTTSLSKALLRPSRIDLQFELNYPSELTRKEFLVYKGLSEDMAQTYAEKSDGMSFADLKEIFISTQVLDKDVDEVITQLKNPLQGKNYLENNITIGL